MVQYSRKQRCSQAELPTEILLKHRAPPLSATSPFTLAPKTHALLLLLLLLLPLVQKHFAIATACFSAFKLGDRIVPLGRRIPASLVHPASLRRIMVGDVAITLLHLLLGWYIRQLLVGTAAVERQSSGKRDLRLFSLLH